MANGDIRKVLASASSHKQNANNSLQSNMLEYTISRHSIVGTTSSLIDRGANGGLAGSDVKVLNKTGLRGGRSQSSIIIQYCIEFIQKLRLSNYSGICPCF
jgi:hypothetical protein